MRGPTGVGWLCVPWVTAERMDQRPAQVSW
jgi:hypothetical protein